MSTPIIARVAITQDEWAEAQKRAIDERKRTSQWIGDLIRAALLQPKESK